MKKTVNIAAYQFATLTDLRTRRSRLLAQCREWNLGGTILLSPEGINLFVAGAGESIEHLLAERGRQSGAAPRHGQMRHQFGALVQGLVDQVFKFVDEDGGLIREG